MQRLAVVLPVEEQQGSNEGQGEGEGRMRELSQIEELVQEEDQEPSLTWEQTGRLVSSGPAQQEGRRTQPSRHVVLAQSKFDNI